MDVIGPLMLALAAVPTLAGLHCYFGQLVCTVTAALLMMERTTVVKEALAVCACVATSIACAWYPTLLYHRRADIVGRAMRGWGTWAVRGVFRDGLGALPEAAALPFDRSSVPRLLRAGYHSCDVALHFFPALYLLQTQADTLAARPGVYCLAATVAARIWCLHVSSFDARVDYKRRRVVPVPGPAGAFLWSRKFSQVYGLFPPVDDAVLRFMYALEVGSSLLLGGAAAVGAYRGRPLTAADYRALGGGGIAAPEAIASAAAAFLAGGLSLIALACVDIRRRVLAGEPSPPQPAARRAAR